MADNKTKTDQRDRSRVAGEQDYEVQYLTEQTGISADQAREIIRAYGNDRETILRAAKAFASAGAKVRSSRL
jgi:glycerol-3-phosphate dehydrogenase